MRITEARYLRMLQSLEHYQYRFGVCMLNANGDEQANSHIYPIGTIACVTAFEKLDHGEIGITISGIQPFQLIDIETQDDGLRLGNIELKAAWSAVALTPELDFLATRLQAVYQNYPELAALYPNAAWQDASWVASRWLEILPISPWQKQNLLQSDCASNCIQFLCKSLTTT